MPARVTGGRPSNYPRIWDLLPDGRMIGLVTPAIDEGAVTTPQIRLVLNWFEELKERVPSK